MPRVQTLFQKANTKLSVSLAAWLLASSTFISAGLGLYRERLMARAYLETLPSYLDAFYAAFRVPDFMYFVLVSGALSVTFIPVFTARLIKDNRRSAWELSSSLLNVLAGVMFVVSVLIMIFADPLIRYVVAPGLPDDVHDLAVAMMRIIAVNPFLFAISSVLASMQQAVGRFFFFTLAPVIYNIGIIFGILFLTQEINIFGTVVWEGGIMGVALGVALGSILQLLVSSLGMHGMRFDYRPLIFWKNKGFHQVLRLLPPRSFDQGMDYFTTLVETNLASRLGAGAISFYHYALTLHFVPINLIGVAISTAFFPQMSATIAEGQMERFRKELRAVIRVIVWLALPVAVVVFLARGYIVALLAPGGSEEIASVLAILVGAILFRSIFHIASRSFYAQQDTKTPLYVSLGVISLHVILAISFFFAGLGLEGLALAQTLAIVIEVFVLFTIMQRRVGGIFTNEFWSNIVLMVSASGLMFVIAYATVRFVPLRAGDETFVVVALKLMLITIVSFAAYLWLSHIFKLSEAKPVIKRLRQTSHDALVAVGWTRR